jgi:hypothetical protein
MGLAQSRTSGYPLAMNWLEKRIPGGSLVNEFKNENQKMAGAASTTEANSAPGCPTADIGDDSTPWPPEDFFGLSELRTLLEVRVKKGHWLGAYQGIWLGFSQGDPNQEFLCASQSPSVLYRKLKKMAPALPIIVRRASSKEALPRQIEPTTRDPTSQLRRSAFEAVGEARRMLDPDGFLFPFVRLKGFEWFVNELENFECTIVEAEAKSLNKAFSELRGVLFKIEDHAGQWNLTRPHDYFGFSAEFVEAIRSEKEKGAFRVASVKAQRRIDKFLVDSEEAVTKRFEKMRQAADFLRTLANAARTKGGKVGDRATGKETREVLSVLQALAQSKPLKAIAQVAVNGQVDDVLTLKKYKSLERTVSRFSKRVARAVLDQYGPRIVSLNYNHLCHALRDWPWIDSHRDRLALMEAARRGLPHLRRD